MREEEEQELLPRPNKSHQNSFSQGVKLTVKSEGCGALLLLKMGLGDIHLPPATNSMLDVTNSSEVANSFPSLYKY